jgi:hypothetical protein
VIETEAETEAETETEVEAAVTMGMMETATMVKEAVETVQTRR